MVDQVSQAGGAAQAQAAQAEKLARGAPARSFKEVASERAGAKKAGYDPQKAAADARRSGGPQGRPESQLEQMLRFGEGGEALEGEGGLDGAGAKGKRGAAAQKGCGDGLGADGAGGQQIAQEAKVAEGKGSEVQQTAQQRSEQSQQLLVSDSEHEAKALFLGRTEGDKVEAFLQRGASDVGRGEASTQTVEGEKLAYTDRASETLSKSETAESQGDDDLKLELEQNLFAGAVGNPLMAQRATEPQAVEEVKAVREIPQAIVDKVVDRARFGMTADGAHEFQIDLKQDVFQGAELKVLTKDGKVTVEMVSDDPALHAAARQLADQMKAKGINVDGVRVLTKAEAKDALAQARGLEGGAAPAQGKRARGLYDDDEDEQPRRRR